MSSIRFYVLSLFLVFATVGQADAQLFKKKKKKNKTTDIIGFTNEVGPTPEEQAKQLQKQLVNPIRKQLNRFNLSLEKDFGYFDYQNAIEEALVVREADGSPLYILPIGSNPTPANPIEGYSDWFAGLTPYLVNRIDDDSHVVSTDTASFVYENSGRINPLTLRLSFSLKKFDKGHFERTGEKIFLDEDMVRIGGGISFGKFKFRNPVNTQGVSQELRSYRLPATNVSTTKLFGSISYNFYSIGDYSIHADVMGGVWKIKANTPGLVQDQITYDPFFNVGIIFQQKFSKYFKGYIRPSFERRSYAVGNDALSTTHQFNIFSISIGLLFKYPIYPRQKYAADQVQMEHVFNGKIYRGRPFYKKQNPRYGQKRVRRKPQGSSFPRPKRPKKKNDNKGLF